MRPSNMALALVAVVVTFVSFPNISFAQAQAKFSFDGVANCRQPSLSNFPIHGEGTGRLSTDGHAALNVDSNFEGRQEYDVKLGQKAFETPGGSATLRVANRHTLRMVRDYPNNTIILEISVVGRSCSLKVQSRLKPGRSEYTLATQMGIAYCARPVITRTLCETL